MCLNNVKRHRSYSGPNSLLVSTGGFIHISPLTWGANPKTCPGRCGDRFLLLQVLALTFSPAAMNYYWNSNIPSPEYRVYREGLDYLLETAEPLITH